MTIAKVHIAAAAAALLAFTAPAAAQEATSKLPGGASSLQETYETWSLACQAKPQTACAISQQQVQQNGQRVLAIELKREADGALTGNLVLPFGLQLNAGATLQIDAETPQQPLRFSTCLPAGCLVTLNFNTEAVAALRGGTVLKVHVQSIDGKEVPLSIQLKGLAAALDRLEVLGGV
ncbi:invasion associated locus B family protein [Sinorhizobium meliloti]|uniref:invasion associated locus B family protein n=1 Tax=Rhizobium meliloti TaxID=382 RepID=UPI00209191A7|nr:invasion associated locus B family protein [Sinorhizobium meliloti]MCO5966731.1 invasion associated locus B family protein [Sinorhizobium meliloti]